MSAAGWVPPRTLGVVLLAATTAAMLTAVALDAPAWVRMPLVLGWVLLVPGWAWARRLRLHDRGDELAVGAAISIALLALLGAAMALTGVWVPLAALVALVVIAAAGLFLPARTSVEPTRR